MNTEALKINITQRILNLNDATILKKVAQLLDKENVIGYDINGNPISEKEYIEDIHTTLQLLQEGTLETYTSEEVKRKIIR